MLLVHSIFGRVAHWGAHKAENNDQFSYQESQATGIGDVKSRGST